MSAQALILFCANSDLGNARHEPCAGVRRRQNQPDDAVCSHAYPPAVESDSTFHAKVNRMIVATSETLTPYCCLFLLLAGLHIWKGISR